MTEKSYRVTWTIDVHAKGPREAARKARFYALRTWCCEVKEHGGGTGHPWIDRGAIDLGTIGSPDGEVQRPEDQIMVAHYGKLFPVREIARASHTDARHFGDCRPGQPILVI